jgi:hypothetical protein
MLQKRSDLGTLFRIRLGKVISGSKKSSGSGFTKKDKWDTRRFYRKRVYFVEKREKRKLKYIQKSGYVEYA